MAIKTETINYQISGQNFSGYFAYDDTLTSLQPGVVIAHEWWGQDAYVKRRATDLAEQGYIAFALDMYGSGQVAADPTEAEQLMTQVIATEGAIEQRFDAAVEALKQHPQVDQQKIHANGYCFGGAIVLGMARAGKELQSVSSFHGLLDTQSPMQKNAFAGKIMVFTGVDDPMVTPEIVAQFEQEMNSAQSNYELISYPNVVHAFTNPAADERRVKFNFDALRYDSAADHDSHTQMLATLSQTR